MGLETGTAILLATLLGAGTAVGLSTANKPDKMQSQSQDTGVQAAPTVEAQSAQRRLARLSKYFTSPNGVLNTSTGTTGVLG